MLKNAQAAQPVLQNALLMQFTEQGFSPSLSLKKNAPGAVYVMIYVSSVQYRLNNFYALYNTGK